MTHNYKWAMKQDPRNKQFRAEMVKMYRDARQEDPAMARLLYRRVCDATKIATEAIAKRLYGS